ncbi:MFS transporter [Staphylococcus americanisciuri]|uniref:MFS transporter n=1 Tax=Staphylococcus americanisciuri TaxID=2973940 RepID=A0ABT2EZW8_9STAP|nr:MFS transporter [Staphylococcus americanisciuri]MCS4485749.1 MFS transporter [Staphylococcus americanisciuri]
MERLTNNFKSLYYSQLFSNIGDTLYIVALIAYVYKVTGEARYSALIPICVTIFLFLSGFVSSYVYSKYSELNTLRIAQVTKTIAMILITVCVYANINIAILFAFICANSFLDGLINPVKNSLIPIIEDVQNIMIANSKMNVMANTVQVISWAIGGALLSLVGHYNVILITILTYIVSVYFISKIDIDKRPTNNNFNILEEFVDMIRFNRGNISSRYINMVTMVESFAHSAWISAILLVFVKIVLKSEDYIFGLVNSFYFIGIIGGGIITSKYNEWILKKARNILILGSIICALLNVMFGFSTWIFCIFFISLFYGLVDQIKTITAHSIVQLNLEEKSIIKVYTLNNMIYSMSFCLGTLFISYIVDTVNVNSAYVIASISYVMSACVSFWYTKYVGRS